MSPKSFRHRTSALKLPKEVYDKYEEVCKKCEHCQTKRVRPSRSRVSGLRANSFGDLLFIDHAEVKIGTFKYVVLIVVDAATSFLAAFPQKSMNSVETIDKNASEFSFFFPRAWVFLLICSCVAKLWAT